jgi:feruloyl esterase
MRSVFPLTALTAALGIVHSNTAGAQDACAALAKISLPDTTLTATHVPSGQFTPPSGGPPGTPPPQPVDVPFCRVSGVVTPAIRFEVWLPEKGAWNGRYQAVGGGGFAGVISYPAMANAIRAGYVTSSTDTGHVAPAVEWLGDPGLLRDYGYRAIHEMTVKSKEILAAYYDKPADYDYFNGCSTGGRQGLMEAQRFPDDFDGIVSGAPVNYFVATHYTQLWVALAAHEKDDAGVLSQDDLALVNRAAIAQCDANDGVRDGVLEDPRTCDLSGDTRVLGQRRQRGAMPSARASRRAAQDLRRSEAPAHRRRHAPESSARWRAELATRDDAGARPNSVRVFRSRRSR